MLVSSELPSRYKLDSSLGSGGFGEVHKAYDTKLDKIVAIKILTNVTPASKSSIKKEFEVLSKLNHPHLVTVYDFGFISDNIPYFTMEYIEGVDLKTFLSTPDTRLHVPHIIDQSLQALGYLHKKDIIHGDIKPENIFISTISNSDILTKILDFGLTSTIQDTSTLISGTPRFIAPEVLSQHTYSTTSDLYSLGMTFIESLTGIQVPRAHEVNSPYLKSTHNELSGLLASNSIRNPSAIASFIIDLCDHNPANRSQSAMEALQRFKVIIDISSHDIAHKLNNVFVDRDREVNLINNFIKRDNIEKRAMVLEGPTGIGKKALMRKAISLAQPEGYFVLDLSDPTFTRNTIERIIETISTNLQSSKRDAFLGRHNKILSIIHTRTDSEKSLAENIRVAYSNIISYLHAISGDDPILLCIPDIERFSEDFYKFIDQFVHELHLPDANMRLLVSRNTDKPSGHIISDTFQRSSNLGYSENIDIHPFKQVDLEELQHNLFNRILFNKHQTKQIIKDTEGTPLLILEYIKYLISKNTIQFEKGIWILDQTSYAEIPIPGNITAYIEEEYSKFNRRTKDILQIMAFWGKDISRDALSTLSNIAIEGIDSYISTLLDSMIIEYSGINSYKLTHNTYIKYIIRRTSKGRAINIHRAILEYLENISSTDYESLATHSIGAQAINKSVTNVFLAVDLLEQRFEYHRCYELLSKQEVLLQKHKKKELLRIIVDRIAPFVLRIGHYHNALRVYERLFDTTDNDSLKANYSKSIANIHYTYFGDLQLAKKYLDIAMKYANKTGDPRIKAELLLISSMINDNSEDLRKKASVLVKDIDIDLYAKISSFLSMSYLQAGKYGKAIALREELYSLLFKVSPTYRRYIYFSLYNSSFYTGEYDKAITYTEESINNNTDLCDDIGLLDDYNNLSGLYYIQGLFYDQIGILRTSLSKLQKYNPCDCSFYLGNLSLAYRSVADYRKAREALHQANFYYNDLNEIHASPWTLSKYSYYFVLMGDIEMENYNNYLKKAIDTSKRTNNSIALGHTKLTKTLYYYQRLQYPYALRNARAALTIFRKANDRDDIVDSLRLMTMILIEKGELDKAQEAITEAREIFDEIHCDYLKPQLFLAEGALARAQNNQDAEAKLKEALKTSKKMFTREYTWQIQRELALYHKDKGELHNALQYYRDAIDMIKEITETIDGDKVKASYLALPFRKRVFDEIKQLKRDISSKK